MCGGTDAAVEDTELMGGLSPRVRGNRGGGLFHQSDAGAIPACAGEPHGQRQRSLALRGYPRVCGGTLAAQAAPAHDDGLSPRVRGNPDGAQPLVVTAGAIPACAGEPVARASVL